MRKTRLQCPAWATAFLGRNLDAKSAETAGTAELCRISPPEAVVSLNGIRKICTRADKVFADDHGEVCINDFLPHLIAEALEVVALQGRPTIRVNCA
jgi:hypothetical protein